MGIMQQHFKYLLFMFTSVSFSWTFNIDLRNPEFYTDRDFSPEDVFPVQSDQNKGILVTAPLFVNGSGAVYRREQNQEQAPFAPKVITLGEKGEPIRHVAFVGFPKANASTKPLVCSPVVVTGCYENPNIKKMCYEIQGPLRELSSFTSAFQECSKKTVDLVFLFDGSTSMQTDEFEKNKVFIEDIMTNLKNTSIKFAAVQFASRWRTVFTFNDYTNGEASALLKKEKHMKGLTNTHHAMNFTLENHFENPANGASPEATKVLVVITDGDPSDSDSGAIKTYDLKNIIRFVIGVKNVDVTKLRVIASEPKDSNTFHIENYDGLPMVLENFQKKIFQTEGTTTALAGNLTDEMSQTGFSAVYSKDALLLGSVGSKTWRGSLHEFRGEIEAQIEDTEQEEDSYMGYSVSVGERNKTVLYFTGAPRYNHVGQVVLFKTTGDKWTPAQRINGEQHGSYFGAEVCSVDVDSDGSTDFLLVGAPLFYQPHEKREGKIYIYRLTEELKLIKQFNVTAPDMGRFGTTITSVADLNGDGLRDVAVGAPLENQNRGAVYLYLGDRRTGIRSAYSQRIMGEKVRRELKFFGQSIDGSIDLGEDGLPDLVIGSRGSAVVLRSKPVFSVMTRLVFEPHKISIEKINCPSSKDDFLPLVTLKICFEMVEATKSSAGAVKPGLNISYTLDVDPMRQTFRGFFNSTTKRRNLTETLELRDRETCFNRSVYMPKCVTDTLSPVKIKMNFSQVDSEGADAVLNADSQKEASVEVPFERRCRNNDTCVAEIEVDFNFTTETLLVADNTYFSVIVTLFNGGEDSYNTSLTIYHSPGLSFSRMSLAQGSKSKPLYICDDYEDRTTCGVSLPVYRSGSQATFKSDFHVIKEYEWQDSLSVTITGNSDNQNSNKGSLTKDIPVQFEIKMILLTGEDSITYLNFTTEDPAPKRLVTKYKMDNHGWMAFPVNVTFVFPTKLEHNFEMNNYQVFVKQNTTRCTEADSKPAIKPKYCTQKLECKYIVCDTFILNNASAEDFELSGEVQFKDLSKHNIPFLTRYTGDGDTIEFKSFLYVTYDKRTYALDSGNQKRKSERPGESSFWEDNDPSEKWNEVQIELIVLPDKLLIIITGAGAGLFFLIVITVCMCKLGCFKRKKYGMDDDDDIDNDCIAAEPFYNDGVAKHPSETEDEEDKPEEDMAFLEKQEVIPISASNDKVTVLE